MGGFTQVRVQFEQQKKIHLEWVCFRNNRFPKFCIRSEKKLRHILVPKWNWSSMLLSFRLFLFSCIFSSSLLVRILTTGLLHGYYRLRFIAGHQHLSSNCFKLHIRVFIYVCICLLINNMCNVTLRRYVLDERVAKNFLFSLTQSLIN